MNHEPLRPVIERITHALRGLSVSDPATYTPGVRSEDEQVETLIARLTESCRPEERARIRAEYLGHGPLEKLFADEANSEIIINGPDSLWIERQGLLSRCDDHFLSDLTYRNCVIRITREAGMQTSLETPFADGHWRGFRVHAAAPPVSPGAHAILTLRRHPANPWTLKRLADQGWAEPVGLQAVRQLIERRSNFLIAGATGSGKTSVLNACLQELPENERVVLIEDTRELTAPNPVSTRLLTRRGGGPGQFREIDQAELLRQSLRMRPDRIVMGEVRGPEAKDLLMAFATGHTGCMGTLHADSARQALLRLEMLIQMGASRWNLHAVRTLVLLSLSCIVVVGRSATGQRRLQGIYRVASLEDVGFLLEQVV